MSTLIKTFINTSVKPLYVSRLVVKK